MKPPNSRSQTTRSSAAPQLIRLVGGLVVILIAMYIAWQKAQERPAQQPPPDRPVQVESPPVDEPQNLPTTEKSATTEKSLPNVRSESARTIKTQIKNAKIRNQDGRVVYEGTIDLQDTLDRIERGQRGSHGNDGTVFQNREKRLPQKSSGYYHEWVHPTPDQRGPGPQRIVTGENGEIYYTPDHYKTFERLDGRQK